MVAGMTGPMREDVERLVNVFRKATFGKGRTVGGVCGQTIDAMMASTMHEVSALTLEDGAFALEALAAENAALREWLKVAVKMLSEQDFEYNKKTNAMIERHAAQLTEARAREAAAETRGWNAAIEAAADTSKDVGKPFARAFVLRRLSGSGYNVGFRAKQRVCVQIARRIRALRRNPKEGV